ncbi:Hypothetical protein SRAE_2000232700 [Strongyloides ratti]|uniref:Protein kinase domain-containing protein n=1 Tax=Strongyloides ratti TaxID=34506 RepID=A0A090LD18_STRRB|nr:Hypothetical protein SRAE_2000232700 [Strongyloides ratti]CEF67666.1 Hypothetical protein SRAE_2000232700 [Strongyloides ratti]
MCGKKQFNLNTFSPNDAMSYSFNSDIWSLGVVIIQTVSYYPFEKFQQLPETFAQGMVEDDKCFSEYLEDYFQLRARLNYASKGHDLEKLLNDHILVQHENERLSALLLRDFLIQNSWCDKDLTVDKEKIVKNLIEVVDVTNKHKLGSFGPNFEVFLSPYDKYTKYQVNGNHFDLSGTKLKIKIVFQSYNILTCTITCNDDTAIWRILFQAKEKDIFSIIDVLRIFISIQGNVKSVISKLRNSNELKEVVSCSSKVKIDSQEDVVIEVSN